MFSTFHKFNAKNDYEVDLSPDDNFADRYRPRKLDETYRDRKKTNDQKPQVKVRLLSQEIVPQSDFTPASIPVKRPLDKTFKDTGNLTAKKTLTDTA